MTEGGYMSTKKIIIISASEAIRNFFTLEAINLGLYAESFEKFQRAHNDLSEYDLLIIDKDTIKQQPLNSAKKEVSVSLSGKNTDIAYPISVHDLKNIYIKIIQESIHKNETHTDTIDTITFLTAEKNIIMFRGKKYLLSDTEIKLLNYLCKNRERVISKKEIDILLNAEESNISNVYICKLRKKLESSLNRQFIVTVHAKGYKIIVNAEWK